MNANVLIVDDHPLLRSGLRQAVEQHPNLTFAAEAASGAMALQRTAESKPDLVVMDIHLPDMDGIEATRQLLELHPSAKVIIFSADASRELVDRALQAGACGYILKKSVAEELLQAMQLVLGGKLYISPEVSAGILEDYRKALVGETVPAKPVLTEREKDLLRLVADGKRNKEIAERLGLSAKSVETYRARLMRKLGCASTAELVRYAIREGVTPA
jgi:DNA-binding NarL/FixJ family response regulator